MLKNPTNPCSGNIATATDSSSSTTPSTIGVNRSQSDDDQISTAHHFDHYHHPNGDHFNNSIPLNSNSNSNPNSSNDVHSQSNAASAVHPQHPHHSFHSNPSTHHQPADEDEINEETLVRQNHTNGACLWPKDYRVKLYKLNDDGNWGDEGTGTIHFELVSPSPSHDEQSESDQSKTIEIQVLSEGEDEDDDVDRVPTILLQHTAQSHILYEKQVYILFIVFIVFDSSTNEMLLFFVH